MALQPDLLAEMAPGGQGGAPSGFVYQPDFVSPGEEARLVKKFAALPLQPLLFHGFPGNRRVLSFGCRYDYSAGVVREAKPIPDWLLELRGKAAAFSGLGAEALRQALVTEYAPGAGIGWHRDKAEFDQVVAISFLSGCILNFRKQAGGKWRRTSVPIAARSVYLLRGEARSVWQHGIRPMAALRYSLTFRNLRDDGRRLPPLKYP